jgi:hypothetical protein
LVYTSSIVSWVGLFGENPKSVCVVTDWSDTGSVWVPVSFQRHFNSCPIKYSSLLKVMPHTHRCPGGSWHFFLCLWRLLYVE